MDKPNDDRILAGVSAGVGGLASILFGYLFGISDTPSMLGLVIKVFVAAFCALLVWFVAKRVLRLLRESSEDAR